jgi:hypothetical protein
LRRVLAVDLPQQVSKIPEIPGWNPAVHRLTTIKEEIKEAAVVVCVTNALGCAEELASRSGRDTVLFQYHPSPD